MLAQLEFMRQSGNECLLCSFLMAINDTSNYSYWKDLVDDGIESHKMYLVTTYPDYCASDPDYPSRQTGNATTGYLPSDILRALKASGRRYTWKSLKNSDKSFKSILRNKNSLVVIGVPTESHLKSDKKLLVKAQTMRGSNLHAICIKGGILMDPGLRKPSRLSDFGLRKSVRRIKYAYQVELQ